MNSGEEQPSHGDSKAISLSARIYRRLLMAYPEEFQEEYADEMVRYFRELCADSLREGGVPALIATWMRTLIELLRSARAERKQRIPEAEKDLWTVAAASSAWPGCGQLYNGHTIKAAAHALLFLVLLLTFGILIIASQPTGTWVVFVLGAILWTYSEIEALVDALRINAAWRDS